MDSYVGVNWQYIKSLNAINEAIEHKDEKCSRDIECLYLAF